MGNRICWLQCWRTYTRFARNCGNCNNIKTYTGKKDFVGNHTILNCFEEKINLWIIGKSVQFIHIWVCNKMWAFCPHFFFLIFLAGYRLQLQIGNYFQKVWKSKRRSNWIYWKENGQDRESCINLPKALLLLVIDLCNTSQSE